MRDRRSVNPGVPAGAPAAHVRSGNGPSVRSLVLSQLMSAGIQPDNEHLASSRVRSRLFEYDGEMFSDEARRVRTNGSFSDSYSRELESAQKYVGSDSREFCRALLRAQGIEVPEGSRDLIRTAFSGGNLSGVLDSIAYARLAVAYESIDDWTRGVVQSGSNNSMKATKVVQYGNVGRMLTMPSGGSVNVLSVGDEAPSTVTLRKAAGIVLDELDFINGDWAGLEGRALEGLANIAVQLRAEIVISMLLQCESQTYSVDSAAVCSAGRGNLLTGQGMDAGSIEAARKVLTTAKFNGRVIAQQPRFLVTPEALWGAATRLINGAEVRSTAYESTVADAVEYSTMNSVRAMNLQHLSDGRFDAGVPDPLDATGQATVTGSATKYWLLAGQNNSPIELTGLNGYGEGGAPMVESEPLTGGKRGRLMTVVSFLNGNWVNTTGLVACRP